MNDSIRRHLLALTCAVGLLGAAPRGALGQEDPEAGVEDAAADATGFEIALQVPVELVIGEERVQHEFFFFAPLTPDNALSIFTIGRFGVDWDEPEANQSFLSTQLIWNFTDWLGLAGGANAVGTSVTPMLGASLVLSNDDGSAYVNLFPSVFFNPHAPAGVSPWSTELFAMAAWTPRLKERWGLFTQVMGGVGAPITLDEHQYSYVQVRLGLDYQGLGQFGFALDQDLLGSGDAFTYADNIGVFFRRVIGP